jgi:hypothetical protein
LQYPQDKYTSQKEDTLGIVLAHLIRQLPSRKRQFFYFAQTIIFSIIKEIQKYEN